MIQVCKLLSKLIGFSAFLTLSLGRGGRREEWNVLEQVGVRCQELPNGGVMYGKWGVNR